MKPNKTFAALLLLASMSYSGAQSLPTTASLTFQPGLTYEDGSALLESDITHYSLYCNGAHVLDKANDFTYNVVVGTAELGSGTHTCGLSETVAGIESVLSNTVDFSLGQRTPSAPTLTVQ